MTAPYLEEPELNWAHIFAIGADDLEITKGDFKALTPDEQKFHPVTMMKQEVSKIWLREQAQRIVDAQLQEKTPFVISTEAEILNRPSPKWLVQDLIQESTIAVLAAPGGLGKTFLSLGLARSLASGAPFFGKTTQRVRTLYVAAEGAAAFGDRVRAWDQAHPSLSVPADAISYVESGVNLKDPASVETLANHVREGDYGLVVLDTFSQLSYIENENSNSETAEVYRAIKSIRDARVGTSILVLHHTPTGTVKARGASAHRDNADTMIMAIPVGDNGEDGFTLSTLNSDNGKQKDGKEISWHGFNLQPVGNSAIVVNNGGKRPLSHFWEKCLPALQEGPKTTAELRAVAGIAGDMRSPEGKRFKRELDHWEKDELVIKSESKTKPVYSLAAHVAAVTS